MTSYNDPATPTPPPDAPSWPDPNPDPADPAALPLRDNAAIQGNVLAAFNKDHQQFLLLGFPDDAGQARAWLLALAPRIATNAAVAAFNERFSLQRRAGGGDPEDLFAVWFNVSLTAEGVGKLAPTDLQALTDRADLDAGIRAWIDGAAAAAPAIGDANPPGAPAGTPPNPNDPSTWLFGAGATPSGGVDALVCVAGDRPEDLAVELQRQRDLAAQHGLRIVFEQRGETLPGAAAGHEHFGFKDGISQPGVVGFDAEDPGRPGEVAGKPGTDLIAPGAFVLGYPGQDAPAIPAPRWMFDGSFLVFRRLAQDVPGFWSGVEDQFAAMDGALKDPAAGGISSADALAARLVGRWRSGTPTASSPVVDLRSGQDPGDDNAFDFGDDHDGVKTPACAHIRKVYPRKGAEAAQITVTEEDAEKRRILRRGIPFGLPFGPGDGRGHGVDAFRGLVFQCYQASLKNQFMFLQAAWINNENFPADGTGADPVIGEETDDRIPVPGGATGTLHFRQFVQTQGTVFAFTPSLPTIALLAGGQALPFA